MSIGGLCRQQEGETLNGDGSMGKSCNNKDSPLSLRNVKGVHLVVENPASEAQGEGAMTNQLQGYVESLLRVAKIRILSSDEFVKAPGQPILAVNVNTQKPPGAWFHIYSIHVELHQNAHLERDPRTLIIGAITWSCRDMGIFKSIDNLRVRLKDQVGNFIDAYLAANPSRE